jgi:hypothetical protein
VPRIRGWEGSGDPLFAIVDWNVARRDLRPGQKALLAERLVTARRGRPRENARIRASPDKDAVARLGVGRTQIPAARRL